MARSKTTSAALDGPQLILDLESAVDSETIEQLVVRWVPHTAVSRNDYNPNAMTAHDRALLRQSLLEDGWTQPIVTLKDGVIVDGEQRWTVAGLPLFAAEVQEIIDKQLERATQGAIISASIMRRLEKAHTRLVELEAEGHPGTIAALTGGLVPITVADFTDDAHKMIATIRHNRARGTHQLDRMAAIADDLLQLGLDMEDMNVRLGMEDDEVRRLLDMATVTERLAEQIGEEEEGQAWTPTAIGGLSEDDAAAQAIQRSSAAAEIAKQYQLALLHRQQAVQQLAQQKIETARIEAAKYNQPFTQLDEQKILAEVEQETIAIAELPDPPELRRLLFFVTIDEYGRCTAVLGDQPVKRFMELIDAAYALIAPKPVDPEPLTEITNGVETVTA